MSTSRLCFFLCLLIAGRAAAAPRQSREQADLVIVGELAQTLSRGVACGVVYSIGEREYRVVRVEKGPLAADHVAIELPCPVDSQPLQLLGMTRLFLVKRRPSTWPAIPHRSVLPERLYAIEQASLLTGILGTKRSEIEQMFAPVAADGQWQVYRQSELAILYRDDIAVRLRLRLPPHWPRDFNMGFPHAQMPIVEGNELRWTGAHALASGVEGRRKDRDFEIWLVREGAAPTPTQ
jgi:hypothetical protein